MRGDPDVNIFILEDDLIQRCRLMRLVKEVAFSNRIEIKKIMDTGKPQELIENIECYLGTQTLYFLDIEIKDSEKKGLEVAKIIRKLDRFASIVFVTTHSEFASLTYSYQVSALQFLTKDQEDHQLKAEIADCLNYVQESAGLKVPQDVFSFTNEYRTIEIPYSKILYFETFFQPHKIALIAADQRLEFYGNLSEIEKMDKRLFRCHRSIVVNLENVLEINRSLSQLKMVGDVTCDVSKRRMKEVEKRRLALLE